MGRSISFDDTVIDAKGKDLPSKPFAGELRQLIIVIVVVLVCVGGLYWIYSLKKENLVLASQVSLFTGRVAALETQAKSFGTLRAENKKLKDDLNAEIGRKNELAVENTRLKGRVTQGERDLEAALSKLKALEQQKVKEKPKPKK